MALSRRSRWAAIGAATTVVVIGGGLVVLRGGSTPVSLDTALERFRQRSEVSARSDRDVSAVKAVTPKSPDKQLVVSVHGKVEASDGLRPAPREGVYVYATRGGDEVDVLGGSRHDYPAETTITVRNAGCGIVERWDALEERWDERESCRTPGGETLKRMTAFHQFFGHADERTLHCSGFTYPAGFKPGQTWTARCASENTTAVTELAAVAWETIDVGGRPVRTMHVRAKTRVTGEQEGTSERDVWGSAAAGVVVRERTTLTSHSNQPVFGRTRYHESYELNLKSLEPRR